MFTRTRRYDSLRIARLPVSPVAGEVSGPSFGLRAPVWPHRSCTTDTSQDGERLGASFAEYGINHDSTPHHDWSTRGLKLDELAIVEPSNDARGLCLAAAPIVNQHAVAWMQ